MSFLVQLCSTLPYLFLPAMRLAPLALVGGGHARTGRFRDCRRGRGDDDSGDSGSASCSKDDFDGAQRRCA